MRNSIKSKGSGAARERFPVSKRAMDLTLCALALIVLGPVMLAVALLIRLSAGSPVLYKAPRAGYKGRPFYELKFRTMVAGSDRQGAFTAKDDKRILPGGKLIRLLKLDELPQIFNILRGEMSVVGPRPEDIPTVEECYDRRQRRVLDARPGLTGIPQVRFFPELSIIDPHGMDAQRHYREVILPMRLELDLEYVRRQSFWFDLGLIFKTMYLVCVKSWAVLLFGAKPLDLSKSQSQTQS